MVCSNGGFFTMIRAGRVVFWVVLLAIFGRAQTTMPAVSSALASPAVFDLLAVDLDGTVHRLGGALSDTPTVLVFLNAECPISRKYTPKLNEIAAAAKSRGCAFFGVISDPFTTRAAAAAFAKEFAIAFPVIFDASGELATLLSPTHVPESFVFDRDGTRIYHGRIDDLFADIGKQRAVSTTHELLDAITAAVNGESPAIFFAAPVGCAFEAWKGGSLPKAVTYTRDVMPILRAHCVECHRAGEIAPFAFDGYASAKKRAAQIATVVERRLMPPWPPVDDHGAFRDTMRLTAREIAILSAFAAGDSPEGDPADRLPDMAPKKEWRLGTPDLVLEMPEAFTVPADGRDIYQCFVIPTGLTETKDVIAVEYKPGAPTVVHHAIFFLDTSGTARRLDAAEPGPGYRQFGGVGFLPTGSLGGYAPGAQPYILPEGTARRLDPKADVVMQVHYHPDGHEVKERGKIGLCFAKAPVAHPLFGMMLATRRIDIPAGEKDYRKDVTLTLPCDVDVHVVTPHMHNVGKSMKLTATAPDGIERTLIRVDDWDFRRQGQYVFKKPVHLSKGTRIDLEAHYDNSDANPSNPSHPPERVRHGEATTDEMCIGFLTVTVENPDDTKLLIAAMMKMGAGDRGRRARGEKDDH